MSAQTVDVEVGQQLPALTVHLSRTDLVRYAGASGDFNPIHHSEFYAERVGLPGVIGHGMLTMASALRVVTDWTGDPAAVSSYGVRFTRPVVVPDDGVGAELVFTATVSAIADGVATIRIEATAPQQGNSGETSGANSGANGGEKVLGMAVAEVDLSKVSTPR